MRVLLLGMPDVASSFDRAMRFPNLGIASIAANMDAAEAYVLDLVLHPRGVIRVVREHLERLKPDVVGLSAMTFQYDTAVYLAAVIKDVLPQCTTVLGGYHATLAYDLISQDPKADAIDFLVRGEGETPMDLLVKALCGEMDLNDVPGLSYRLEGRWVHNPRGGLEEISGIRLPARRNRLCGGYHYFGKPFDVVETSRGCLKSCRFCCIGKMYGREYRCYPVERVIEDIKDARENGAQGIFFADDNINMLPARTMELCSVIRDAGLSHLDYITQADVAGFVKEPELAREMAAAGFKGVFLGIESVAPENWKFLRKHNSFEDTHKVVQSLRNNGITVAGGFIVGNPDDDEASVRAAFTTARELPVDHAIMWCLTPYPGTEIRESMTAEGLVANPDDFAKYNGFICNVRTRHLSHRKLARLIAREGAKLYFHPKFMIRSRRWPVSTHALRSYFGGALEYITRAPRNRLYASRHKM